MTVEELSKYVVDNSLFRFKGRLLFYKSQITFYFL